MTKDNSIDRHKDMPEMNSISVAMQQANLSIEIYKGMFTLQSGTNIVKIDGKVTYDWFPNSGAHFSGKPELDIVELFSISDSSNSCKIFIDDLEFGDAFITETNYKSSDNDIQIKGTLSKQVVLGDKSITVNRILFSIPNLREFYGLPVKSGTEKNLVVSSSRLRFEDDNYIITIDKSNDYKARKNSLKVKGGYILLYAGEMTCKKGSITHGKTRELFHCFNTFLSFLNGRRTSALFIQGIYENQVIWSDYTSYLVDPYKTVISWPPKHSTTGFNDLWNNYQLIWSDPDDKKFLTSLIHWYVEANGHAGFSEGSIILAQTALELIYNWWVIEQKGLVLGKDSENISASNKIRLLLSQSQIDFKAPIGFKNLQAFISSTENISDAPDAIVYIRNSIVHSQVEKRKKLSQINPTVKYEALQLSIWYIEMSLLHILNFNSTYFNRCFKTAYASDAEMNVPWKII